MQQFQIMAPKINDNILLCIRILTFCILFCYVQVGTLFNITGAFEIKVANRIYIVNLFYTGHNVGNTVTSFCFYCKWGGRTKNFPVQSDS